MDSWRFLKRLLNIPILDKTVFNAIVVVRLLYSSKTSRRKSLLERDFTNSLSFISEANQKPAPTHYTYSIINTDPT